MLPMWLPSASASAIAGVLGPVSHYIFWIRHPLDGPAPYYATVFLLFQPAAFYCLLNLAALRTREVILALVAVETCYCVSTLLSVSIYRLFLHPCRQFPGPFWARLSAIWKLRSGKGLQYALIYDLHKKHGDIVRFGPRNISIRDVNALSDYLGNQSSCIRGALYTPGKHQSLVTRSGGEHKARRKLFDQGLSPRHVQSFIPEFNRLANLFLTQMHRSSGKPIAINAWMHYLTFDTIGQMAFGSDYGQLETGKEHQGVATISKYMSLNPFYTSLPWLFNIIGAIPGLPNPDEGLRAISRAQLEKRQQAKSEHSDVMSVLLQAQEQGFQYPYPKSSLVDDVFLLHIAGSDTTGTALTVLFYVLCIYPKVQVQLREEILEVVTDPESAPNWSKLTSLPFLDAVMNEAQRLWPITPQGVERETLPGKPTRIGPYLIPGDVAVSVPCWSLHRDERYWECPHEFLPERWTTKPELIKDKRAFIPFSYGKTVCAGKYFSLMETKVFMAKVLSAFDIDFAPGEDGSKMMDGQKDYFTMWYPDLEIVFTPRPSSN